MKLTFRTWVSIGTAVLVLVILFFARNELVRAWHLLTQVNLWILALLIPVLLFDYYASGEVGFSYLRAKGRIKDLPHLAQIQTSLEMNFVNHVLPSGGVSGISYMTWRLAQFGVPASRALMAQVVRFVMGIVAFLVLLIVAVLIVTVDGSVNRVIILISATISGILIAAIVLCVYIIISPSRIRKISRGLSGSINHLVRRVTFGKRRKVLDSDRTEAFMMEMHQDYLELRRDMTVLKWPFIWSIIFTILEVAIFFIVFLALGFVVNPALILIAYGIALLAGFAVITPGGTGAYEALMVAFLTIAGVDNGTAIAGIVLARVIILLAILLAGWGFYQRALARSHAS